jgi:hypothetical protein
MTRSNVVSANETTQLATDRHAPYAGVFANAVVAIDRGRFVGKRGVLVAATRLQREFLVEIDGGGGRHWVACEFVVLIAADGDSGPFCRTDGNRESP